METLSKARQELCNVEHLIALQCCPFYLAQRLWYDDGITPRFRVFVCEIRFQAKSPYYQFFLFDEKIKHPRTLKRIKGDLRFVAGIQNTFAEEIESYSKRLKDLEARGLVNVRPKYSSMDTVEIIHHCAVSHRSNALMNLRPDDVEWFDRIFELNHHKQ